MTGRLKPLRRDAAVNREKLLVAASEAFTRKGLDTSLEEIARQATVSIGTLYNHFPGREALFDAVLPDRVAAIDRLAEAALADPDAWRGFTGFLDGLFTMMADDHGMRHVMTREYPNAELLTEACHRGMVNIAAILEHTRKAGQLREDFETEDLGCLIWAMAQVIDTTVHVTPDAWRRFLAFILDGLRPEAASDIDVPVMTRGQVAKALLGPRR